MGNALHQSTQIKIVVNNIGILVRYFVSKLRLKAYSHYEKVRVKKPRARQLFSASLFIA